MIGVRDFPVPRSIDVRGIKARVSVPDNGIVDGKILVFLSANFQCALERFLRAACGTVGKYGKGPGMIFKSCSDSLIVHEYRLALLDMNSSRETVIGIEESGIYTCKHVLAFAAFALAEL